MRQGHGTRKHHEHHATPFNDPGHAAEFDRSSEMSEVRTRLAEKLVDLLGLKGDELVLDLATGTGRFARPVGRLLRTGRVVGIDQAMAMLRVGREHEEPIPAYSQTACDAASLPFKADGFDRAFVAFSLHHFRDREIVAREALRVLKTGGKLVVLDPVVNEARDDQDRALEEKINQVFRRTHGENFRFHTAKSIHALLDRAGFDIERADLLTYSFDQDGMAGVPTGRHWLEAAEELEGSAPELAQRLREDYFVWTRSGETVHVNGKFSYALVRAVKPV